MEWLKASDLKSMRFPTTNDATTAAADYLKKQGFHVDMSKSADRLVPDYMSFRNTYWGQSQPVNYKMLWKMFLEDPVIYGCVNLLVEGVVGDGYRLKDGKRLHQKILKKLLAKNEFSRAIRDFTYQIFIFGDAYIEIERDDTDTKSIKNDKDLQKVYSAKKYNKSQKVLEQVDGEEYECGWYGCSDCADLMIGTKESNGWPGTKLHKINSQYRTEPQVHGFVREFYVADASTIRIDYNEHGEVIKYIQRVLHRRVDFYPNEMIHLSMNNIGGRQYGHSLLVSVIETLQAKQSAERFNSDYFRRGAIPRMVYMIPNLNEAQQVRIQNQLATLQPQQDVILTSSDPNMKAQPLLPTNNDMQFAELLKYYKKNIIGSIGVPSVFLSETEGSNRSNAQIQLEAWDRKIRGYKNIIADMLNKQFFTKENFGFDDVIFEFVEDNNREELRDAQTASLMAPMTDKIDEKSRRLISFNEVRAKMKLPLQEDQDEDEPPPVISQDQMPMMPGAPGGFGQQRQAWNVRPMGDSDPRANQKRKENSESQNTEQQMDNKSIGPESYDSRPYAMGDHRMRDTEMWQTERREHPSFSDDEIDQIWIDHHRKEDMGGTPGEASRAEAPEDEKKKVESTKELIPELMKLRMAHEQFRGVIPRDHEVGESPTSNEKSDIDPKHDVTIRDREVQNPFGATLLSQEKQKNQLEAVLNARAKEVMQVVLNPIANSQNLNTDRVFPKDANDVPQRGLPLTQNVPPNQEGSRQETQPERDEIDAMGRTVWASNDADKPKSKKNEERDRQVREGLLRSPDNDAIDLKKTKATFYQGMDQTEEE